MKTEGGVELTQTQVGQVNAFVELMKTWDKHLCINAIAGSLTIMLRGDTPQNNNPEQSNTGVLNLKMLSLVSIQGVRMLTVVIGSVITTTN